MTHKIEIIYSNHPLEELSQDSSGTSVIELHKDRDKNYDTKTTYRLMFEMNDTDVSKKFVDVWNSYSDEGKYVLKSNTCATLSVVEILQRQELMNEIITQINNNKYDDWLVSNELFLELNGEDMQVDKLNALYQFSQDCSLYITQDMINKSKHGLMTEEHSAYLKNILTLLKKVNYLVHRIKSSTGSSLEDFTVIRHTTAKLRDTVELTERDYKLVTPCVAPTSNGVLFLDYYTTGKDLESCWRTNDLETIKSQKVIKQKYIDSAFNFGFNTELIPTDETHNYEKLRNNNLKNQWCEENDVGDYYEYWKPEYNVGRIILGDCVDENITDVISYRDMLNHYPYVIDIIVK